MTSSTDVFQWMDPTKEKNWHSARQSKDSTLAVIVINEEDNFCSIISKYYFMIKEIYSQYSMKEFKKKQKISFFLNVVTIL